MKIYSVFDEEFKNYGQVIEGFRVAVVLPKGTNTDKPEYKAINKEDALLTARNKWIVELTGGPVVLTESDIA